MDWFESRGDEERDHLEKDFENITMQGDEDSKLLLNLRPSRGGY